MVYSKKTISFCETIGNKYGKDFVIHKGTCEECKKCKMIDIDDIIRDRKKKLCKDNKNPSDYIFEWGGEMFKQFSSLYTAIMADPLLGAYEDNGTIRTKDGIDCFKELPDKCKNIKFMGMMHTWDRRLRGYKIIKKK